MRLLRYLRRTIILIVTMLGGVWTAMMLVVMAGSLALSIAMTMVPFVFTAVSGIVESVTGVRSLASRHSDDVSRLERRAIRERARGRAASDRADNLARQLTDSRAVETRLTRQLADSRAAESRLARELSNSRVTYRGMRTAARDAVRDTARRVSRRTVNSTARSIASMAGEGLPAIGIGVIVAATAWELKDACELMGEMRELDAAFNPDDPISDDEVCGMKVPTRGELWAMILESPGSAWHTARQMYEGLPDISISRSYERTLLFLNSVWQAVFGGSSDAEDITP